MDSVAGSWAALQGQEIVNLARTTRYIMNGYGPPGLQVKAQCDCDEDQIRTLVDCDAECWESPAADPAPWYDPSVPESADFAGFYPTALDGLDSTYTREITEVVTGGGGGILGRLRAKPRTLVWHGFLFGRTCCSVAYGLRWLTSVLRQSRCAAECGGEQLELLMCCPAPVLYPPNDSECLDLPLPVIADDPFRTLYNTGLLEGPLIRSQRKGSGGCGCSAIMEIEFSIAAGNPHLYGPPVVLADCVPWEIQDLCPDWLETPPAVCPPLEPGLFTTGCDTSPARVLTDPNCITPSLPPVFNVEDSCFCNPYLPVTTCVAVPVSTFGQAFQGVPIFQVYSGSSALHSTTIRVIENPLSEPNCGVLATDACNFCDFITIRYIPAFSILTIDGVNRRVTITTAGGVVQSGEQFMVGNWSWPVLECIDYCVCATVDDFTAATDACFSMSIYPREF